MTSRQCVCWLRSSCLATSFFYIFPWTVCEGYAVVTREQGKQTTPLWMLFEGEKIWRWSNGERFCETRIVRGERNDGNGGAFRLRDRRRGGIERKEHLVHRVPRRRLVYIPVYIFRNSLDGVSEKLLTNRRYDHSREVTDIILKEVKLNDEKLVARVLSNDFEESVHSW